MGKMPDMVRVEKMVTIEIDKDKAIDDLKRLHGHPPYNGWSNTCYGDGYFANDIKQRFGMSIEELEKAVGYQKYHQAWSRAMQNFPR